MHADEARLHYAPTSVGALMDPTFLRDAVRDAEGGYRAVMAPSRALFARSIQAMRRFRLRMRAHASGPLQGRSG